MDIIISDDGVQFRYYLHERIVQIYMENRVMCNVYYLHEWIGQIYMENRIKSLKYWDWNQRQPKLFKEIMETYERITSNYTINSSNAYFQEFITASWMT